MVKPVDGVHVKMIVFGLAICPDCKKPAVQIDRTIFCVHCGQVNCTGINGDEGKKDERSG